MANVTTPVISGIVVLLAGALAFIAVVDGESESPPPDVVAPAVDTSLSDLAPAVERVLIGSGDAWIYEGEVTAGLPGELARVLDAYQVPLLVPAGEGQ